MAKSVKQSEKSSVALPYENLAQAIQQLRAGRCFSREDLSQRTALPVALIQEIEEGRHVFLAVAHRQRLARELRVTPSQLQALELPDLGNPAGDAALSREEALALAQQTHRCPACQSPLRIATFDRQDMHGHPVTAVQYTCTQCLFRHRQETESDFS